MRIEHMTGAEGRPKTSSQAATGMTNGRDRLRRIGVPRRRGAGFSLIEILIVLGLLLVLGTLAVVGFTQVRARANTSAARVLVDNTVEAVNLYYATMNQYPDNETGLEALITPPEDEELAEQWAGPYLKEGSVPTDPWGNPLQYELRETEGGLGEETGPPFRVWSYGADGQDGTEDDISNIEDDEEMV